MHPQLGRLDLRCQTLLDPDQNRLMLIFTATPGTQDAEKLDLLTVLRNRSVPCGQYSPWMTGN